MRINNVSVDNLFGMFSHNIPLNREEHVTIIHGPNGYGKTVILGLINSFFNSRYQQLRRVRFDTLSLTMDDGSEATISNTRQPKGDKPEEVAPSLVVRYADAKGGTLIHRIAPFTRDNLDISIGAIEREIPGLDRIGPELWLYEPTQEHLTLGEVLERFAEQLPHTRGKPATEPEWLGALRQAINVRFIETQRLLNFTVGRRVTREFQRAYERQLPLVPAVANYSDEVVSAIQAKLTEYAALSQSLDRTFPTRLVKGTAPSELTLAQLRVNLANLEMKRTQLMTTGLLDKEREVDLSDFQAIEENNRNVLSVYIEDVGKKLAVFEELTAKIDLMVRIINSRFTHKTMSINKRNGFVFQTLEGQELSPTGLSSGEQHELVLLYELLFKVTPNSLILIDEPELSLHVLWQQQFLKDLQEIIRLSGFDVLIATHSPQIIHDRWDLTVQLRGPDDERIPNAA